MRPVGIPSARKGKTLEEEYGIEKAMEIRRKLIQNHKGKGFKRKIIICEGCGKSKEVINYVQQKYCSRECKQKFYKPSEETKQKMSNFGKLNYKGENHWNWKGGITPFSKTFGSKAQWKEWRLMVFGRDNFTCQWCGSKGVYLEPHHIFAKSKFPMQVFEVSNGITLCRPCHNKTKGKEGKMIAFFQTLLLRR